MKERISQVWARLEGREFLARLKTEGDHMDWKWRLLGALGVAVVCVIGFVWWEFWRLTKM